MSASLDQHRGKGQSNNVSNGPMKDMNKDGEFESYLQSQHQHQQQQQQQQPQGYGAAMPGASDPYYYPNVTFPYVSQASMNEGAWSTGGDAMFSVGSYDYPGMFGFGYPQLTWDLTAGGDYWNAMAPRKDYNDYYRADGIQMDAYGQAINGELEPTMKTIDQGLKGMTLADKKHMIEAQLQPPPDMMPQINSHVAAPPPEHMCMPTMSGNPLPPPLPPQQPQPPPPQQQQQQQQQPAPKKSSWAAIASQPARPQPVMPTRTFARHAAGGGASKHNMDIGMWDGMSNGKPVAPVRQPPSWPAARSRSNVSVSYNHNGNHAASSHSNDHCQRAASPNHDDDAHDSPDDDGGHMLTGIDLKSYNPTENNLNVKGARFFIIKSYSEDDIHRSIKYNIWCSTEHGNKRLDAAFREREGKGPVYLLYSVNGSGHFCGVAQMISLVDYSNSSSVWAQDKWKGQFQVKWVYVKDVPNSQLRYIRLENNDNKPVTNSRDTQEVPLEKGKQVVKIIHNYNNTTSIFDDFQHYERRQEDDTRKDRRTTRR